jgi:hypothetical protein
MVTKNIFCFFCLVFFLSFAQSQANLIEKRWKLVEIYQLDTAQVYIKNIELNSIAHHEQQVFHCHEMGLEYQALFFTHDSLCYRLEHSLTNDSKLYPPQRYLLLNKQSTLFLLRSKETCTVLFLSPSMLILGRQKNLIEVYIPLEQDDDEPILPADYIWEYYKAFYPNRFKRYEEGLH